MKRCRGYCQLGKPDGEGVRIYCDLPQHHWGWHEHDSSRLLVSWYKRCPRSERKAEEAHVVELDTAGSPDRDNLPSVTRSSSTGPDVQYVHVEDTRDQTIADLRTLLDAAVERLRHESSHEFRCPAWQSTARCVCGLDELLARLEARV
jgi:hypothetical protein